MTAASFNRPRLNWLIAGWNLFGVGTLALGAYMVIASDLGRAVDPVRASWFIGGLATAGSGVVVCFVVLNVLHLLAQREVVIRAGRIEIRRWLEALLGRSGQMWPLSALGEVRFVVEDGGAKIHLDGSSGSAFSIWFWSVSDARALADALRALEISVIWELPYTQLNER